RLVPVRPAVPVLAHVAAADVATGLAGPEMDPRVAERDARVADVVLRRDGARLPEMRTGAHRRGRVPCHGPGHEATARASPAPSRIRVGTTIGTSVEVRRPRPTSPGR